MVTTNKISDRTQQIIEDKFEYGRIKLYMHGNNEEINKTNNERTSTSFK